MHEPLTILQVSTSDRAGGAERIGWNLFNEYRSAGHDSLLAVGRKRTNDANVFTLLNDRRGGPWYRFCHAVGRRLRNCPRWLRGGGRLGRLLQHWADPSKAFGLEDFRFPGTWRILDLCDRSPDIIHCHNLHGGYFDLRALPYLSRNAAVIVTLHDAWMLSGHCAHSFDCERWRTGCGRCPDLSVYPRIERDATAYNWRRKRRIYHRSRLHVATPCRWLMAKVEQSMLAPAVCQARVIPNGVDLSLFRPADRKAVRQELGLPAEAFILLFVANGIRKNRWKDYATMRAAVASVSQAQSDARVLFIGLGEAGPAGHVGRAELRFVSFCDDPKETARYYQAADLYLHAAHAETFPTTILEALAFGTPVVATKVGGVDEQVQGLHLASEAPCSMIIDNCHGVDNATGFLVAAGDAPAMAHAVEYFLRNRLILKRLGENAARAARQRFDLRRQADAYLSWYMQLADREQHVPAQTSPRTPVCPVGEEARHERIG